MSAVPSVRRSTPARSLRIAIASALFASAGFAVAQDADQASAGGGALIDQASWTKPGISAKPGYELVFSDEFDGDALDPVKWNTGLRWDGEFNGERYEYRVINDENQFYVNILSEDEEHLRTVAPVYDPFQFGDGRLAIRAALNPLKTSNENASYGPLQQIVKQQEFLSGVISTHGKFARKYGYFEARMKIPGEVGTFPAFWLYYDRSRADGTQRTEIDIMENLGHAPWYIYNSFHFFKNVSLRNGGDANFLKPSPSGQVYSGTDYSEDFHTYAVDWAPGRITWYIDGQKVSELFSDEANFEELYLKINLAMGGRWTNFPANAGGLGRSADRFYPNGDDIANFSNPALEIDYVRVYAPR